MLSFRAKRGIPLAFLPAQRGIPRFARNDASKVSMKNKLPKPGNCRDLNSGKDGANPKDNGNESREFRSSRNHGWSHLRALRCTMTAEISARRITVIFTRKTGSG